MAVEFTEVEFTKPQELAQSEEDLTTKLGGTQLEHNWALDWPKVVACIPRGMAQLEMQWLTLPFAK